MRSYRIIESEEEKKRQTDDINDYDDEERTREHSNYTQKHEPKTEISRNNR